VRPFETSRGQRDVVQASSVPNSARASTASAADVSESAVRVTRWLLGKALADQLAEL
jgi:hypothetical protein